ncbi:hypothetical protein RRG08_035378 [Elysia crispata]|uniref:Uncharacterized protein n=1 Tax=Elysia crispata TaxID=231223 RepID=A0AAE1CS37_9GAST|nr:hypothetical protein RRG08_035378 [Elysia crispata]
MQSSEPETKSSDADHLCVKYEVMSMSYFCPVSLLTRSQTTQWGSPTHCLYFPPAVETAEGNRSPNSFYRQRTNARNLRGTSTAFKKREEASRNRVMFRDGLGGVPSSHAVNQLILGPALLMDYATSLRDSMTSIHQYTSSRLALVEISYERPCCRIRLYERLGKYSNYSFSFSLVVSNKTDISFNFGYVSRGVPADLRNEGGSNRDGK